MRKMKDSGIEWIGEIPCNWDVSKIKYLIKNPLQYGASESGIDYDEKLPRYIRITDITMDNELKEDGKLSLDLATAKPYLLQDEDILFARSGASVGKTFFYRKEFGVSAFAGYLIRASFDKTIACPKFVFFNTLGLNYENWKNQSFSQATIQNIGADKYNEYVLPTPPFGEQKRIADFLDAKCADIDQIRADIEKQIEILTDYKKSVIAEAVTKGLDPKVKLKDSGIKWVGKIPEHWECKPIGVFFNEVNKKNVNGLVTNPLKFTYGTIVAKQNFDADSDEYVAKTILNYNVVDFGTIMINGLNLNYDLISQRVGLVKEKGIITSAYLAIKAKDFSKINPFYAMYAFKFYDFCMAFHNMGEGVRKTLGFDELRHVYFMLPSIKEQEQIVSYLDEKCSDIDATIAEKQKQLETLEDYKKSLIFEYVTGKKEVV